MLDGWYEAEIHIKSLAKSRKLSNVESYLLAYMAIYERVNFKGALQFLMYCEKISAKEAWDIEKYVDDRVLRIDE